MSEFWAQSSKDKRRSDLWSFKEQRSKELWCKATNYTNTSTTLYTDIDKVEPQSAIIKNTKQKVRL